MTNLFFTARYYPDYENIHKKKWIILNQWISRYLHVEELPVLVCYPFTSSPASPRGLYCYNWQTTLIVTLLSHTLNLSRPGKQHIFNQYHCNHGPIFIHYCETEWSMIWNYLIWYQSVIMTIYRWFRYISRSYGMILKIHPVPGRDVSLTG